MQMLRTITVAIPICFQKRPRRACFEGSDVIRILFAKWLDEKSFRERRRIRISDVCDETGLSRQTVSRIANVPGYVTSTETVERLCRYFGCSPGDLLQLVPEEPDGHRARDVGP